MFFYETHNHKEYIKNWRPISFFNVDYKIMSTALATRLKKTLPDLKSCQQTAYVKNRFIGEGGMRYIRNQKRF